MNDLGTYDEIVELSGIKIPFYPSIFTQNIAKAVRAGHYEGKEAREIVRIIQDDERVLELGAGIGYVSSLIAKDPRTQAVRTYEANPQLLPVIQEVHALNDVTNVEVINEILSNDLRAPSVKFYIRHDFWASSMLEKPWKYKQAIDVPVSSFSGVVESFRPTLIVCDIEGGELDLFRNANLEGVKKVYVELHQKVLGRRGMKEVFDVMSARGFHYDQHHSHGSVVLFSHVDRT